jgi:preprotein translocase subunit SecD
LFNVRIYDSIKAEFDLGKTVESSVKLGMKNVLFQIIDVYAVLVIGALALLIGVAGLNTMALQALICLIAGAFCNLLWHRLINAAMLATSKDKYKYFRFVRGDDDDE